jgi:hypothetical protein
MLIGVPTERASNELRVALVPDSVGRLAKAGAQVVVERGAGQRAGYPDAAFEKAGAGLGDTAAVLAADLICKVQKPTAPEIAAMKPGAHLISLLQPASSAEAIAALETRGVTAFALELRPPHHARAVHGCPLVAGHRRRLQGGAARRLVDASSSCRCSRPRRARSTPSKALRPRRGRGRAAWRSPRRGGSARW